MHNAHWKPFQAVRRQRLAMRVSSQSQQLRLVFNFFEVVRFFKDAESLLTAATNQNPQISKTVEKL